MLFQVQILKSMGATLYKVTSQKEFIAIDPEKNEPTRIDINMSQLSLFKYKGLFIVFYISIRCMIMI